MVLFALAKERGIKTLIFDVTFRPDRLILSEDFREGNQMLANFDSTAEVTLQTLPQYLQDHYKDISSSRRPPSYHFAYFKKEHARIREMFRRGKALVPFIKDGSVFERASQRFFKMIRMDAQEEYEKYQKKVDFSKPFVYVPLHYQPECTTSPQGGIFVDQVHQVRMLAAALPSGWELYVKEHPAQWPSHVRDYTPQRYKGMYKEIAAIPHVRLVPVSTPTYDLADKAKATATASGTAGWESVLRGKCALIFGYPWYMSAPGVLRVSSVEECRNALQRVASGEKPDIQKLFKYFASLDAVTFWGFLDFVNEREKKFDVSREVEDMYNVISKALTD
jgi:hypothetical protein